MGELRNALTRLELGTLAAATFIEKAGNQHRLQQHDRTYHGNLPAILLPGRRFATVDGAAGRQQALVDPPELQLPPVIFGPRKFAGWRLDIAWLLAVEDADGNADGGSAAAQCRVHRTADNFPKERIVMG